MRRALCWVAMAVMFLSVPASGGAEERRGTEAVRSKAEKQPVIWQLTIDAQAPTGRPRSLPALYVGYGALQAIDIWSTSAAVGRGARETNPVLAPLGGNPMATIAIKAATTGATIYFVERIWRKNRMAAVVVMAAVNGATAAVVARNARNASR